MRKFLIGLTAMSLAAAVPASAEDDHWLGLAGSSELELGAYLAALAVVIAVIASNAGSANDEPVSP